MAGRFVQFETTVTTDASGDATAYLPDADEPQGGPANGAVWAIVYTKTDYDAGVDFTITAETSGLTVWTESNVNASKTVFPRVAANDTAGVAMLYAAGGTAVSGGPPPLANERLQIVVASGGNAKSGNFRVILG